MSNGSLFITTTAFLDAAMACMELDSQVITPGRVFVTHGEPEACCSPPTLAAWGELVPEVAENNLSGCVIIPRARVTVVTDTCWPVWDEPSAPPADLLNDAAEVSYRQAYAMWTGIANGITNGRMGDEPRPQVGNLTMDRPLGGCARWRTQWIVDIDLAATG